MLAQAMQAGNSTTCKCSKMNNIVFLSKHQILPVIYFLCLLPIDRFLALHVFIVGWVMIFFLSTKTWWQLVILLCAGLLHDIAYIYPLGLSSLIFFFITLSFSQPKLNVPWLKIIGIFATAQLFSFLDYDRVQFDTMTIVRLISSLIIGYFIFIQHKVTRTTVT